MQKISIRPIEFGDTDLIVKWRNSDAVRLNFIDRRELTKEIHENWMNTKVLVGNVVQFIICVDGTPVGSVYLRDIDKKHQKAEFGIFIGEELKQGHGIGQEAGKQILKYAFDELNLNRVFLRVLAENEHAINCYKKIGFVQEGYARERR